ncbi:MAG: hypothetical protein EPO57_07160 [Chitinophagaceae bacterium]|nr:MAG: hypothetical protein EPO57_07160 [Chitinophagaceae bacterium]
MRKLLIYIFIVSSLLLGVAGKCKKKTPPPPAEASLQVTLDPAANSVQPPAPQATFPLKVTINSTMPAQGVTIAISSKKDDGSVDPAFFTASQNSTVAVNDFTITGTPVSIICITTVTVTSRTDANNKWTGTYRYSRKP